MDFPRTFLATTALHEFWDKDKPILFLGNWCTPYKNQKIWEHLDAVYLKEPLLHHDPDAAILYIERVYQNIFPLLATWLNKVHQTEHSLEYWEIFIGSFLFIHIQTCYERYYRLKKAFELFPDLETLGLSEECYLTPFTISEYYLWSIQSDLWNLQLYTQIIKARFKPLKEYKNYFDQSEIEQRFKLSHSHQSSYAWRTQLKINLMWFLIRILGSKAIVMIQQDFSKKNLFQLMKISKFKILAAPPRKPASQVYSSCKRFPNQSLRREISSLATENFPEEDDFSKLVLDLLAVNMPMSFIENYSQYCEISEREYPYFAKWVMGSPVASGESLKIWQAKNQHRGMKRIGLQHGGGYGALKSISDEYLEHKISDIYITWGTRKANPKVIGLPSVPICEYLESDVNQLSVLQKNDKILWVATEFTRYPMPEIKLALGAGHYETIYYTWQTTIIKLLDPEIFSKIVMRLRYTDFSDHWNYLKIECPHLKIHRPENRSSFYSQIKEAKLLLFDNLNTTHLYGFAANRPSILFFDERIWTLQESVKPLFKQLAEVGIFHTSPTSAACMINQMGNDPFTWWFSEKVQSARKAYCHYFANNSTQWVKVWKQQLLELLN